MEVLRDYSKVFSDSNSQISRGKASELLAEISAGNSTGTISGTPP